MKAYFIGLVIMGNYYKYGTSAKVFHRIRLPYQTKERGKQ